MKHSENTTIKADSLYIPATELRKYYGLKVGIDDSGNTYIEIFHTSIMNELWKDTIILEKKDGN